MWCTWLKKNATYGYNNHPVVGFQNYYYFIIIQNDHCLHYLQPRVQYGNKLKHIFKNMVFLLSVLYLLLF